MDGLFGQQPVTVAVGFDVPPEFTLGAELVQHAHQPGRKMITGLFQLTNIGELAVSLLW
jgi:hypothetical protein